MPKKSKASNGDLLIFKIGSGMRESCPEIHDKKKKDLQPISVKIKQASVELALNNFASAKANNHVLKQSLMKRSN